jgi:hypothetical protein
MTALIISGPRLRYEWERLRAGLEAPPWELATSENRRYWTEGWWQGHVLEPIETAPRDGTYVILFGPSGHIGTPLRAEVCNYDAVYRPRNPWVTHAGDAFTDGGEAPTFWMPLPRRIGR